MALIVVLQLVGLNPAAADASGTVWDGNIDTDWYNAVDSEFTLDTAEQLAGLASLVNAGNDMEGKFFYLGADILLNDVGDFENWDTTPPVRNWLPIGSMSNPFAGILEGEGHKISGLYISEPLTNVLGLFGCLDENGEVRNVTLDFCYIYGYDQIGGIAGINSGVIYECKVSGIIKGDHNYVGGITGIYQGGYIEFCETAGEIGGARYVGGIAGQSSQFMYTCKNTAEVSATVELAGGIAGQILTGGQINNCKNFGSVSAPRYAGGLAGHVSEYGFVVQSFNEGDIDSSEYYVGGIVGINEGVIKESYNDGFISGSYVVGGIAGINHDLIIDSYNLGEVYSSADYAGGIAGQCEGTSRIEYCYNEGKIKSTGLMTGGIASLQSGNGSILYSYNSGVIEGISVGGILYKNSGLIENCYNIGTIASDEAGGLVLLNLGNIRYCYVGCEVNALSGAAVALNNGGTIFSIYYNDELFAFDPIAFGGGTAVDIYGKSTAEMQASAFVDILNLDEDIYMSDRLSLNNGFPVFRKFYELKADEPYAVDSEIWDGSVDISWYNGIDTEFTLYTAEQLAGFAQIVNDGTDSFIGKTIKLDYNIRLNGTDLWESWDETTVGLLSWTPIGKLDGLLNPSFAGTFDGQGHTVSGVYISATTDQQGLFGRISENGTVNDLTVEKSFIKGREKVGGIAGVSSGSVEDCRFYGKVKGYGDAGGIAGDIYAFSTVASSANYGTVSSDLDNAGGIVGYSFEGSTIRDCYNHGDVSAIGYFAGGIAGYAGGDVSGAYNTGDITGAHYVGGLFGLNTNFEGGYSLGSVTGSTFVGGITGVTHGNFSNAYCDSSTGLPVFGGNNGSASGYGTKTLEEMLEPAFINNLGNRFMTDFFHLNHGLPVLKELEVKGEDYTRNIRFPTQLRALSNLASSFPEIYLTQNYMMYNNIDLGAQWTVTGNTATLTRGTAFQPIGTSDTSGFSGTFTSDAHLISGIFIQENNPYVGLFTYLNGGIVSVVTVTDSWIKGEHTVGAIAGKVGEDSIINHCVNEATVAAFGAESVIGGIAGENYGYISFCINNGTVIGGLNVGGIVGKNYASISLCENIANIEAIAGPMENIGGIAGTNETTGEIDNSTNRGLISGESFIGGIAGRNYNTIVGCTNNASITGGSLVGGIAGMAEGVSKYDTSNIINCHNTGSVQGTTQTGGIVGQIMFATLQECNNDGDITGYLNTGGIAGSVSSSSIQNCYSNSAVTATNDNTGGIAGYIAGSTIEVCAVNGGTVSGQSFVGGIAGICEDFGGENQIIESQNYAAVTGAATFSCTGGIAGKFSYGTIYFCENFGDISGAAQTGGIAGNAEGARIENCTNAAGVTAQSSTAGGIAALLYNSTISACLNLGDVTANFVAGGLAGQTVAEIGIFESRIEYSGNTGNVHAGLEEAGGLAGAMRSTDTFINCYNTGNISSISGDAGGLVSECNGALRNCYNTGTVTSGVGARGGLADSIQATGLISNCYSLDTACPSAVGTDSVYDNLIKTTAQFTGGEVCFLLQSANDHTVWTHTTLDGSEDPLLYVLFGGDSVFQVIFNSSETSQTDTVYVIEGGTVEFPEYEYAGHSLVSWNDDPDGEGTEYDETTPITASATLKRRTKRPKKRQTTNKKITLKTPRTRGVFYMHCKREKGK